MRREMKNTPALGDPSAGLKLPGTAKFAAPPGLELPPGLVAGDKVELPPGLDDTSPTASVSMRSFSGDPADDEVVSIPIARVRINGLPKALVNDEMMDAILQQAGLEDAVHDLVLTPGCGSVMVSFSNLGAAKKCVQHFKGCRWDASGAVVRCEIIPIMPNGSIMAHKRSAEPARIPLVPRPLPAKAPVCKPNAGLRTALSSAAPLFVPGAAARRAGPLKIVNEEFKLPASARSEISIDEETRISTSEDDSLPHMTDFENV